MTSFFVILKGFVQIKMQQADGLLVARARPGSSTTLSSPSGPSKKESFHLE